jgi:phenylpropionate dioxygenase-like ring-hydroxylating dioxygenase large terminal subunit
MTMTELLSRPLAAVGDVPFRITDPAFVPRERYSDQEFFELENEKLWPHVWQMACRLEEIPEVGDFVEYTVAKYSVIVVRTSATEIKAYQNACRHRATQLAVGCGKFRGGQIVCPFHGWRWNLDGTPSGLYGKEGFDERSLAEEDLKLVECQIGTWANCVFINMDRNAPSLEEFLHPMPDLLDPLRVNRQYVYWWKGVRLHANWKTAIEAFLEGWHVMGTHPQLTRGAGEAFPADFQNHLDAFDSGHMYLAQAHDGEVSSDLGMSDESEAEETIEFTRLVYEGGDSQVLRKDMHVLEGLRHVDCEPGQFAAKMAEALYTWNTGAGIKLPDPDPEVLARWGSNSFVFPNFAIHPLFGNAIVYRCRPDTESPEHCLFEIWAVTLFPDGYQPAKPNYEEYAPDDREHWPLIPLQDFSNIERQQRGLHQPGFKAMRLATKYEAGIANLHTTIDRYLAE